MANNTSQLPKEWLQWLYNVLRPEYQYVDLAYQDVAVCIQTYPTLKVRTKIHVNDQGHQELLLSIYGTIVTSSRHGVPVEVWVPKSYPVIPPMIYIRIPQSNSQKMAIKPNNFVDINGKFYNPILSYWNGAADRSFNLTAVCFTLTDCFNRELPIFANHETGIALNTVNKKSNGSEDCAEYVGTTSLNPDQTPILPPKPAEMQKSLIVTKQTPPLPSKPSQTELRTTAAPVTLPVSEPEVIIPQVVDLMDSEEVNTSYNASTSTSELKQQIINKINNIIQTEFPDSRFEFQISKFQEIVSQFQNVLQFEKTQLANFDNDITVSESILKQKIDEIQQELIKADKFEEPELSEIIVGETLVHSQLYRLVAESKSLDDTMYCLSRLHDNGKISLEVFMKQYRSLAREQFRIKALIGKICGILKNKCG